MSGKCLEFCNTGFVSAIKVMLLGVNRNIRKNNSSRSKNVPFNMPTEFTSAGVHFACPFWVAMFVPSTHSGLQILTSVVKTCLVLRRAAQCKRSDVLPEVSYGFADVNHTAQLICIELYMKRIYMYVCTYIRT